jgi:hypothetical protein
MTFAKLKKLLKGVTKAIANTKNQHSLNAKLVTLKKTQKRCSKQSKKNYRYAQVIDAKLIKKREAEYKALTFEKVWKDLIRIKP